MAYIPANSASNMRAGAQKRIHKANASGDVLSRMKANNNMVKVLDGTNRDNPNLSVSQFGK